MATTGIYDGRKMRLFVDDGIGGAKKAIGWATTMTVDLTSEESTINHKDNEGGGVFSESEVKSLGGTISFEAYWAQTTPNATSTKLYDELFDLWKARKKIAFAIKTNESGDSQLVGYANISGLSGTATDKEEATFTGSLTITGEVSRATVT